MLERKRRVQVDIRIFRGRITQSGNDELLRVNYSLIEAHYRSQWGSKGPCNTSSLSRLSRFIAAGFFFFFFFFLPFFEETEGEAFLFLPNLPWTVPQLRAGRKMGGRRCRLSRHFSALPGYPTAETCPVIGSWSRPLLHLSHLVLLLLLLLLLLRMVLFHAPSVSTFLTVYYIHRKV